PPAAPGPGRGRSPTCRSRAPAAVSTPRAVGGRRGPTSTSRSAAGSRRFQPTSPSVDGEDLSLAGADDKKQIEFQPTSPSVDGEDQSPRVRGRSSLTGFNPPRRRWTARTPEESARRQRAEVSTHLAV